jgi:hypothetical protein
MLNNEKVVKLPVRESIRSKIMEQIVKTESDGFVINQFLENSSEKIIPLLQRQKVFPIVPEQIEKFAKEAGLDTDQLKKDMTSEVVEIELANVRDLANRFEITGTPFLIIGEEAFPGAIPADQINAALDK